jgi:hypothetical protein
MGGSGSAHEGEACGPARARERTAFFHRLPRVRARAIPVIAGPIIGGRRTVRPRREALSRQGGDSQRPRLLPRSTLRSRANLVFEYYLFNGYHKLHEQCSGELALRA